MHGFPPDRKPPLQADHEGLQQRFEEHERLPGLQVAPEAGEWGPQAATYQPQRLPSHQPQAQQAQPQNNRGDDGGLIPSALERDSPATAAATTAALPPVDDDVGSPKWEGSPPTQTVSPDHEAHEVAGGGGALGALAPAMQARKSRRRKFIIIGAVAGIVAVVAAVLGGTLGTLLKRDSDDGRKADDQTGGGESGPSGSPTTSADPSAMTGTLTSVASYLYPTAISWGAPHLEVLAATPNRERSVYRKYRGSDSASPSDFVPASPNDMDMEVVGGKVDISKTPFVAVASRPDPSQNHTELLIANSEGNLQLKGHNNSMAWSGRGDPDNWQPVGNGVAGASSSPALVSHAALGGANVMDLFVLASSSSSSKSQVAHMRFDGSRWGDATTLSSPDLLPSIPPRAAAFRSSQASSTNTNPRVDVFVVHATTRHLLHGVHDRGAWSLLGSGAEQLEDLGGFVTSPPTIVSPAGRGLVVFARGGDGRLWMRSSSRDGSFSSSWTLAGDDDGVEILGEPDAISWTETRIDVFAWSKAGNALLHRVFTESDDNVGWKPTAGGWESVARGISGPPKAVSDMAGRMHVFAYGNGTDLVWRTWTAERGWLGSDVSVLAQVPG